MLVLKDQLIAVTRNYSMQYVGMRIILLAYMQGRSTLALQRPLTPQRLDAVTNIDSFCSAKSIHTRATQYQQFCKMCDITYRGSLLDSATRAISQLANSVSQWRTDWQSTNFPINQSINIRLIGNWQSALANERTLDEHDFKTGYWLKINSVPSCQ
jgi:hypothetical protein